MKKIIILTIFIAILSILSNIYTKDADIIIDNLKTKVLDFWNKSTDHIEKYYSELLTEFDKDVDQIEEEFKKEKGTLSDEAKNLFKELKEKVQYDLNNFKTEFEKEADKAKSSEHFIVEKIEREHHKTQ